MMIAYPLAAQANSLRTQGILSETRPQRWGTGGREFKSPRSDQFNQAVIRLHSSSKNQKGRKRDAPRMVPSRCVKCCREPGVGSVLFVAPRVVEG